MKKRQRNSWTKQEDQALIYIKEELKVKKWTDVATKLKQINNLHDRKDKHCRDRQISCQFIYENFLMKSQQRRKTWTTQHDIKLIQLYMQYGSKWSQIASFFEGINGVYIKNKFYSRMRKGIRTVNYLVDAFFLRNWKKLQTDIVFKLVSCAAEKFDFNNQSPIGRKLEQKITFIEQIVSKVFMLSFVDKVNIKKSVKQSGENALNPQMIQNLIEQINFIDENIQKRRSNKTLQDFSPIIQKKQNPKNPQMAIEYRTKIQQNSHKYYENSQISENIERQNNLKTNLANKKIQIISKNSFENQYENWNTNCFLKKQNYSYQQLWQKEKTNIKNNEKTKKQCGYKLIINSINKNLKVQDLKEINKQLILQQQISDKQHNNQNLQQQIFFH